MTPVHDLREVDVGALEGSADPSFMRRWHEGEPMERVEAFPDFCARVGRGLGGALALEHPVLVVAHGGVFRAIEKLLDFAGKTDVPNCCLAHFEPPASLGGTVLATSAPPMALSSLATTGTSVEAIGIWKREPQCGQRPFLPAK
jgi:probable phosphoglycerate mutase